MRFATIRFADHTHAARIDGDEAIVLDCADVGELLRRGIGQVPELESRPWDPDDAATLITSPDKIICVGVNYRDHIAEMGREQPSAPTYFAKYRRALIGAHDPIQLPDPSVTTQADWEVELAVVIGAECRHVDRTGALNAIAGYTVLNDVSMRDYQRRTTQFLAGKTFEGSTPVGPTLTTRDELGDGSGLAIRSEVDGVTKQESNTSELCFDALDIVADLSRIITLEPGDVIATGTPGGVGAARTPPEWLTDGSVVRCEIEGIGATENLCRL